MIVDTEKSPSSSSGSDMLGESDVSVYVYSLVVSKKAIQRHAESGDNRKNLTLTVYQNLVYIQSPAM